jgi:hypothetical protein
VGIAEDLREGTTTLLAAAQSVSDSLAAFEKARRALQAVADQSSCCEPEPLPIFFACAICEPVDDFKDLEITYAGDYCDGPELVSRIVELAELVDRLTETPTATASLAA